jgi:hypothetical protein
MRRAMTVTGATAALLVGGAATASAAPPEQEVIPLQCGDAGPLEVVTNGNGEFTSARLLDSTGVFVPTAFGEITITAVPPGGEAIVMTSDPSEKGGGDVGPRNRPSVTCTFDFTDTLAEEEDGLPADTEITISGEVTGFVTGRP